MGLLTRGVVGRSSSDPSAEVLHHAQLRVNHRLDELPLRYERAGGVRGRRAGLSECRAGRVAAAPWRAIPPEWPGAPVDVVVDGLEGDDFAAALSRVFLREGL